jgi:hypothetical protein
VQAVEIHTGGTLAPGASPGMLNATGNVVFSDGAFNVELNGTTAGTNHDQLTAAGNITIAGPLNITLGYTPSTNDVFTILNNTGTAPINGNFNGLAEGATLSVGGHDLQITYVGGDGNDVVLTVLQTLDAPILSIVSAGPDQAMISWSPDTPGFILQETTALPVTNWVNSDSGTNNPVTLPASGIKYFRVFKP